MNRRARLTPVDVVFIAVAVAALAFLSEPFYSVLSSSGASQSTLLMFSMLPPAMMTMILYVTYTTSIIGGGQ